VGAAAVRRALLQLLLLEDDRDLGQAVADHLRGAGHAVVWCRSIAQARQAREFDLALLDRRLPDGEALDLLRDWRQAGIANPVIVLTARDQLSDRIGGLKAGADDYVVKPFDLDELLARIEAVSRRWPSGRSAASTLRLDLEARRAFCGAEAVELTAMEWAVLRCLARHPGRIYSRDDIERRLADDGFADGDSNSLEVIVSRLRKKLGPSLISTHRGLGYRLDG
jgi:two-component system, OmpR family, response regulator